VSIAPTKRRRFLWAAWWTAPPEATPFRKPDAASGGARSRDEACAAAERAAGRPLSEIDPRWAVAWSRVLRGEAPWPSKRPATETTTRPAKPQPRKGTKPWALAALGLAGSSPSVPDIKRAFRAMALRTHPDRGGEDAQFIEAKRAYDIALVAAESRRTERRPHPGRKR
jgi:hypothetical protein